MTRVQFGWVLPGGPRHSITRSDFLRVINEGFLTIQGYFDSIWVTDHLQYDNRPILEGWTLLTYYAALYPQFNYGTAVLSQSFRNPALLAKMAATFQYVSGKRLILGLGAGWKEDEYSAYGYAFPSTRIRVEELEESLQILKALWHDEQATVAGKHYHVENAFCEPKPEEPPIIMVGGTKPRLLHAVARYADWWNVSQIGIENYRQRVQECERACQDARRDLSTLRRTWFGNCVCAPTQSQVNALNIRHLRAENAFVGTPAQVVEQMRPFVDLGVDYFLLNCGGFPDLTTLKTLAHEVLPAFTS